MSYVVRVGVSVLLYRHADKALLLGMRKGSHGAGTWSFPGGHLEYGEGIQECASRELFEETGIRLPPSAFKKVSFTNTTFPDDEYASGKPKQYVTLYMRALTMLDFAPDTKETEKCAGWLWARKPLHPLFLPIQDVIREGFDPWRHLV
jgi:8-oxo-dGTP diphosphatase